MTYTSVTPLENNKLRPLDHSPIESKMAYLKEEWVFSKKRGI